MTDKTVTEDYLQELVGELDAVIDEIEAIVEAI